MELCKVYFWLVGGQRLILEHCLIYPQFQEFVIILLYTPPILCEENSSFTCL